VNNEQADIYNANIAMKGQHEDITLNGNYSATDKKMNLKLDVNSLNLAAAKAFTQGTLIDIGGILKAHANINGTLEQPQVNGNINFQKAFLIPEITGSKLSLSNENILMDTKGIHFKNFTLTDTTNHKAILNGDILTNDFKNYNFALDFLARNFTIINTPQQTNKLFYGKLNLDTHIKLSGDINAPWQKLL